MIENGLKRVQGGVGLVVEKKKKLKKKSGHKSPSYTTILG